MQSVAYFAARHRCGPPPTHGLNFVRFARLAPAGSAGAAGGISVARAVEIGTRNGLLQCGHVTSSRAYSGAFMVRLILALVQKNFQYFQPFTAAMRRITARSLGYGASSLITSSETTSPISKLVVPK